MKKHITLAALLVAGSALANAANVNQTYTSSDWDSGKLALESNFSLSETNWTISFSLALDPSTGKGEWGTRFFYTSSNENPGSNAFFFWLGSKQNNNYGYVNFRGLGSQLGDADFRLKDSAGKAIVLGKETYTFDLIRDGDLMAIGVKDSSNNIIASICDNQWNTVAEMNATISQFTSDISVDSQASWTMPSVTLSPIGVIPEPSAFGLLAGLGALALVGARRRRR